MAKPFFRPPAEGAPPPRVLQVIRRSQGNAEEVRLDTAKQGTGLPWEIKIGPPERGGHTNRHLGGVDVEITETQYYSINGMSSLVFDPTGCRFARPARSLPKLQPADQRVLLVARQ